MPSRGTRFDRDYLLAWEAAGEFYTDDGIVESAARCAYCGDRAECREHLTPYSWVEREIRSNPGGEHDLWTWIVPACNQCNGIASDGLFRSPQAKRDFIQERLRAKYPDAFVHDAWSDDEYDDLGPSLRQFVMAKQAENEIARMRVEYAGPLPDLMGSPNLHLAVNDALDQREGHGGRVRRSPIGVEAA